MRALLLLGCVTLGVMAWASTCTLTQALEAARARGAAPFADGADLIVAQGDAGVPAALADELRALPGVANARRFSVVRGVIPELGDRPVLLMGIELPHAMAPTLPSEVRLDALDQAAWVQALLSGQVPVVLGTELAEALRERPARFAMAVQGHRHAMLRAGTVATADGMAALLNGNVLVTRWQEAARLSGRGDLVSRIDVTLRSGTAVNQVRKKIEACVRGRATVHTVGAYDERTRDVLQGPSLAFQLGGAGAVLVGAFLIFSVLAVSVEERRHAIGILRAFGMTSVQIAGMFLREAFVLGLGGALAGIGLGAALAQLAIGPLRAIVSDVLVTLPEARVTLTATSILAGLGLGLACTVVAALVPAWRAAAVEPAETLRPVPPPPNGRRSLARVFLGAGICLAGMVAWSFAETLVPRAGSVVAVGLLSTGTLFLAPEIVLGMALVARHLCKELIPLPEKLGIDSLVRAPGRTGWGVAGVICTVAMMTMTAGLVVSNDHAIRAWVHHGIAGDLFVTAGGPLTATGQMLPLAPDVTERIRRAIPGAETVGMAFRYVHWPAGEQGARVLVVALDADAYRSINEPRTPSIRDLRAFQELAARADGMVVSENFAQQHGVRPGDLVSLPSAKGLVQLRVCGMTTDYSCSRGTIFVDRQRYHAILDAERMDEISVYLPQGVDAETARKTLLREPWAADARLCVLTRPELKDHVLGMVQRIFQLAYAQEVVVGLVAVFGITSCLLISVLQRRRDFGILRALGASSWQILRMVIAEGTLMGLLGTVIGLVAGALLELYAVRILLVAETGFTCPLIVPTWAIVTVACVVVGSATGAALFPAWRASRIPITCALATE